MLINAGYMYTYNPHYNLKILYNLHTQKKCCIKRTYPSPDSGSAALAMPASTSDAMFRINNSKKHREKMTASG